MDLGFLKWVTELGILRETFAVVLLDSKNLLVDVHAVDTLGQNEFVVVTDSSCCHSLTLHNPTTYRCRTKYLVGN